MSETRLYGLKNCDTCRKARAWMDGHGLPYAFIDYRAGPVGAEVLKDWARQVGGWEKLVNRSSTTWRGLPESSRQPAGEADWLALVVANPQLVRRPVLVTGDGRVSVGFSDPAWQARFRL
ncbi:arsenate reductase [Pigmentiphaga soli]|uniref:Arsenate reductase n=1 Tax=Pigmentiphaga soli TaxID=1007095 RepID=A0ABP8HCV3_9BURK